MAQNLIDPRTRQATAFYAALAVALYDVMRQGFQPLNTIFLASAAGLTTLGMLSAFLKQAPTSDQNHKELDQG
jgi:hypothetical protein